MKPTLVTGGNIGTYVSEQLQAKGAPVRVLAKADFRDAASLAAAFDGVGTFFSVSPMVENLAELGVRSIEAARRAGVEYIVRSSAMGAGEDAAIEVGRLHGCVERALEQSGIPHTIVQPNAFMQNFLMQAATIKSHGAFYLPQGSG